jgi:KUP system potassium uptake protein
VVLATLATVIASQAVISGAYSMTRQAVQLGLLPRLEVIYTSAREAGQIYMPQVNWLLLAAVVAAVLGFGSSRRWPSAYGIAVTLTMLITTVLTFFVVRHAWRYPLPLALATTSCFRGCWTCCWWWHAPSSSGWRLVSHCRRHGPGGSDGHLAARPRDPDGNHPP